MKKFPPSANAERAEPAETLVCFDDVYAAYVPAIQAACGRYRWSNADPRDLGQAGAIALWKSVNAFDPDKGVPFEHYARRAISHAVATEARHERRHWADRVVGRWADDEDIDLDDLTTSSAAYDLTSRGHEVTDRVLLAQVDSLVGTLPTQLQRIYELRHVCGLSQAECAQKMEVSQQRISKLESQLAEFLRKVGGAALN